MGLVSPQAVPLEEAVIGAVMLDKSAIRAIPFFKPEHCYRPENEAVFVAIKSLAAKGQPVDILTVMEELKATGKLEFAGGPAYLAELTHRVGSSANVEYHARIVVQKFIARQVIKIGTQSARDAYDPASDPFEVLDNVFKAYIDLRSFEDRREQSAREVADAMMESSLKAFQRGDKFLGFPFTGIPDVDLMLGGLEEGDVIMFVGRPKSGKSSLLNAIIRQHILTNTPGYFASGEMTNIMTGFRVASALSGIPSGELKLGKQHGDPAMFDRFQKSLEDMAAAPIYFDDGGFSLARINEFVIQGIERGCKYFYIDRAELVEEFLKARSSDWVQALVKIMAQMRALAVRNKVGIVMFIQGNSEVEKTKGKRLEAHHAYGATAAQSSCTKMVGIYRPSIYDMTTFEAGPFAGQSVEGRCEIHTLLSTNYGKGEALVGFNGPCQLMYQLGQSGQAGPDDEDYKEEDIPF